MGRACHFLTGLLIRGLILMPLICPMRCFISGCVVMRRAMSLPGKTICFRTRSFIITRMMEHRAVCSFVIQMVFDLKYSHLKSPNQAMIIQTAPVQFTRNGKRSPTDDCPLRRLSKGNRAGDRLLIVSGWTRARAFPHNQFRRNNHRIFRRHGLCLGFIQPGE